MGSIPYGNFLLPLNIQQRVFPPNQFDRCLWEQDDRWRRIKADGGLPKLCRGLRYKAPPWIVAPSSAEPFRKINSISLPANDGADHTVLSFLVPNGYDGVAEIFVNNYTGSGFEEGSGDLTWRVQLNQRYPKDLGNIQFSIGTLKAPSPVNSSPQILQSDQLVKYVVNVSSSSTLAGGRIVCAIIGYWYPRGVYVP